MATATVPAVAALEGVYLSNVANRHRHEELMREEALKGQRELAAAVLVAAREWAELKEPVVLGLGKGMTVQDMIEFADTDSGIRLRAVNQELTAALTRARLFFAEAELRQTAGHLSAFVEGFAETVNGPILKARSPNKEEQALAGVRELWRFRATLRHFEERSAELLSSPTWHRRRSIGERLRLVPPVRWIGRRK